MVYPGRPSTGCLNCKQRKIKCDEARPNCAQCTNTKRVCSGYTNAFDLVFRDQTNLLHQRAERKNRKSKRSQIVGTGPTGLAETHAQALARIPQESSVRITGQDSSKERSIPPATDISRSLNESSIDVAVCIFFNNFVLIPRHPDGQRGFLECLLPLYAAALHDSLLSLATSSVALAISGGIPQKREDYRLSRVVFGKALRRTASVIQDPDESIKDETLLAVLLLGFYERLTAAVGTSNLSGSHDAGALALIKYRNQRSSQSDLSTRLSLAVHTQIVGSVVELPQSSATAPKDLVEHASDLPRNTASRYTQVSAQAANLRRFANSIFRNSDSISQESIAKVLNLTRKVDAMMQNWVNSVPESWAYSAASGFDCPPMVLRETFVYRNRIDIYQDHTFVSVWNSYRSNRIMVLSILFECISRLRSHIEDALLREGFAALQATQELADDICASVPYQLGTRLAGGPFDQASAEYPYLGGIKSSTDQRRAVASLGGWNLLEPLKSAAGVTSLRRGQREWIMGQLERIGQIYNIPRRSTRPPQMAEGGKAVGINGNAADKCQASVSPCNDQK